MYCKRCGSSDDRKSGKIRGKQRCNCRACGYHFTDTHGRGYPLKASGFTSLHTKHGIACLLEVDASTVMRWIREKRKKMMQDLKASLPETLDKMDIIEMDETWHDTQKKARKLWVWIAVSRLHATRQKQSLFSRSNISCTLLKRSK